MPRPSEQWLQNRILQHVVAKRQLEESAADVGGADWLSAIDERYRGRAAGFHRLAVYLTELGTLPAEMRLTFEPLHPLPPDVLEEFVAAQLTEMGAEPDRAYGFSAVSRALVRSYNPLADPFDLLHVPAGQDLFLFDPLVGFAIWREGSTIRNGWLGNMRDVLALEGAPQPVKDILLRSRSDHFSPGVCVYERLVGPRMRQRWRSARDEAGIPTVVIDSPAQLEAFADDLRNACELSGAPVSLVFRGQTEEYPLPDRRKLATPGGICPYADVRDHSLVPSLYRRYDGFTADPGRFRSFVSHLLDWSLYSDVVFGDPARYYTPDGQPYTPKDQPADATAKMTLAFSGVSRDRAFEDLGPYTTWTITGPEGEVIDHYVKVFQPGRDSVRRNLILQHYGAPTPLVDVTRDIGVAQWFAFNRIAVGEQGLTTSGMVAAPFRSSVIYAFLVLEGMAPLAHTERLVSADESLRPHRQACAVLGGAGNLYRNAVSRFIAVKIRFGDGFLPKDLPAAAHLFPGPDEDRMLARLLEQYRVEADPAVAFPVYWFPPHA